MGARLSDSELAARIRAANQRRAARLVERQKAAGRVAMTIWIDATTKERVDAARHGAALNETAERLLLAGLAATTTSAANRDTPSVLTQVGGDTSERDAMFREVEALLDLGLSGVKIAQRLNNAGYRSATGKLLSGANLLRDYRAWADKAGTADLSTVGVETDIG